MLIGVISDTHGLLRPEAIEALHGCELIIHAGDVGAKGILDELASIAPVKAIRGNIDTDPWARRLPATRVVEAGGLRIFVIHDVKQMNDSGDERYDVVISGHSHKAIVQERDGVFYLNPGSAGPRRFRLPVTVARLTIASGRPEALIVQLSA